MTLLLTMSIIVSMMFFFTKHPLSMGFNLLMQTIIVSVMTGMMNYNFWYSFILFLIMVGGMLILFIYMTSVASNEKFNLSMKMISMIMIMVIMMMIAYQLIEPSIMTIETTTQLTQHMKTENQWMMSLTKFLTYPQNLKLVMLMSYLFLTLIAVVKITMIKYGPLRTQ
ncbi:NADH dehydrogenase subunit 6 (mitochondrion) [Agrilus planipennis]|uniref:NADH-ubiquinone oxidoreductase chain 6 n=1 Tax=Agrilus planipennis TaxID=224129 RepID=A0A1B0VL51_AGRPL|nr:NADH dehydrogenase subunit 6 [Agrilus planipennis]AMV73982.1 NADH dehydrogenase subunit 6 [Agrilus planipennis]